jgi:hypothetical protein
MVTKVDDKPFLERLIAQPSRSFRRYIPVFKEVGRCSNVTRSARLSTKSLKSCADHQQITNNSLAY